MPNDDTLKCTTVGVGRGLASSKCVIERWMAWGPVSDSVSMVNR